MKKNKWITDYVKSNYQQMSDREMATFCNIGYVSIFNIRKKHNLERSLEFQHERRVLSGVKGGTSTQLKHDTNGENNSNWKGGISDELTRYYNVQKERFPEKNRARRLVINARRRGDLKQAPCVICGNLKSFAHHEDYSKPLDVIWLCRTHHDDLHRGKIDKEFLTSRVAMAQTKLISNHELIIS